MSVQLLHVQNRFTLYFSAQALQPEARTYRGKNREIRQHSRRVFLFAHNSRIICYNYTRVERSHIYISLITRAHTKHMPRLISASVVVVVNVEWVFHLTTGLTAACVEFINGAS